MNRKQKIALWLGLANLAVILLFPPFDSFPATDTRALIFAGFQFLFAHGSNEVINSNVLFEADGHDVTQGWSVIVAGVARSMRSDEEIAEAEQAQLVPWTDSEKKHFVRVRPRNVTGRRFQFAAGRVEVPPTEDPVLG